MESMEFSNENIHYTILDQTRSSCEKSVHRQNRAICSALTTDLQSPVASLRVQMLRFKYKFLYVYI